MKAKIEEIEALRAREAEEEVVEAMLREGYESGLRASARMTGRRLVLDAGVEGMGREGRRKGNDRERQDERRGGREGRGVTGSWERVRY